MMFYNRLVFRSVVNLCLDHSDIFGCHLIQCHAFREVLTYQSVMIFIQSTPPQMIGVSKILVGTKCLFDLGVISKLITVIKRDSAKVCFVWL